MDADMTAETGMISVPPGSVTLSDRRTRRQWVADVTSFRLAAHPVTRGEYERLRRLRGGTPTTGTPADRTPAVNISRWDAVRFCKRIVGAGGDCPWHMP
jgi:hypothetical protein